MGRGERGISPLENWEDVPLPGKLGRHPHPWKT